MTARGDVSVVELPPSDNWTPAQALAAAAKLPFSEVVVIGHDGEGNLMIRNSRMDLQTLLWLSEELRLHALDLG